MTTMNANGATQRKTLATQLDRLDTILDGLSDALSESVADAVKDVIGQAVSEAVQAAVAEVLSSPELLRAALEKHCPPEAIPVQPAPEPKPTLKEKLKTAASVVGQKMKEAASQAKQKLREVGATVCVAGKVAGKIATTVPNILSTVARKAWAFRKPCAIAEGVGVVSGAICYLGGQVFSSVANGLSGEAITLSAMTLPLKRLFWGGSSST